MSDPAEALREVHEAVEIALDCAERARLAGPDGAYREERYRELWEAIKKIHAATDRLAREVWEAGGEAALRAVEAEAKRRGAVWAGDNLEVPEPPWLPRNRK